MASVSFQGVEKVFEDGVRAVVDCHLEARDGELLALLGPSGCGKTTLLRLVAGLETPTRGEIRVGERRVDHLPPAERDVAMIFQDYALYPHKTVAQNLEFPLRMRGTRSGERARRVREVAELLGIHPLLGKRPGQLSGGQQQRVAIGRALVREPEAFLMDEPLSNLDARLRARIRTELGALQRRLGITTLFVTHDQNEALTLGRRVAVMREGRVHQIGAPDDLYRKPADLFVASFVGEPPMNLVSGTLERDDGSWRVRMGERMAPLPGHLDVQAGDGDRRVVVGLRPEAMKLVPADADEALLKARVRSVEAVGPYHRLVRLAGARAEAGDAPAEVSSEWTVQVAREARRPEVGDVVGASADARRLHVFAWDGRRLSGAEGG